MIDGVDDHRMINYLIRVHMWERMVRYIDINVKEWLLRLFDVVEDPNIEREVIGFEIVKVSSHSKGDVVVRRFDP